MPSKPWALDLSGKRAPQFKSELALLSAENANLEEVLTLDDLVKGPIAYFSATGITSGDLLKGVVKNGDTPVFDSFVLSTNRRPSLPKDLRH